jgi:hypothetical protein
VKPQLWMKTRMRSRVERTTIVEPGGAEFGKFTNAHWYLPTLMTVSVRTYRCCWVREEWLEWTTAAGSAPSWLEQRFEKESS